MAGFGSEQEGSRCALNLRIAEASGNVDFCLGANYGNGCFRLIKCAKPRLRISGNFCNAQGECCDDRCLVIYAKGQRL